VKVKPTRALVGQVEPGAVVARRSCVTRAGVPAAGRTKEQV
jgi:hypothetical protein